MDVLIKAAAIAVTGALLALALKKTNPETALLIAVAVTALVLGYAVNGVREVRDFMQTLSELAGLNGEILEIVVKCVGIAVVSRISADVCRDAGQLGAASGLEFAGAVSAMLVALPLFRTVVDTVGGLV